MFRIDWPGTASSGYADYIPVELFSRERKQKTISHFIIGPKGECLKALCRLSVRGSSADFDYGGPHKQHNEKEGVDIGAMRIRFSDDNRGEMVDVLWKGEGEADYRGDLAVFSFAEDDLAVMEGNKQFAAHIRSERAVLWAKKKKDQVIGERGALICEGCKSNFKTLYGESEYACYEVHHLIPIGNGVKRITKLSDLAILCANCHRAIHSVSPMPTIAEFCKTIIRESPSEYHD